MADFQRPLLSATDEGQTQYGKKDIPSFGDLKDMYNQKWAKEKKEFQTQLKANFFNLVERHAEGKQEIFMLCVPERKEKLYTDAFKDYSKNEIRYYYLDEDIDTILNIKEGIILLNYVIL